MQNNNLTKDELVILYIMLKFKNIKMSKLPINKLLYECELNSVDNYGKKITNFKFIHYKKGPYNKNLDDVIKKFASYNTIKDKNNYTIKDEYINYQINLDDDIKKIIDESLDKWVERCSKGYMVLGSLLNEVYMTPPLLDTPYNEEIDLMKYGKNSGISKVLIHSNELKKIKNRANNYKKELMDIINGKY